MKMSIGLDAVAIIIQSVLALVTIGAWLLNRRESRAKIENMDALTEKTKAEKDQIEFNENFAIYQQLQAERKSSEDTIRRISKDIANLQTDLRITNESLGAAASREIHLMDELNKYKGWYVAMMSRQGTLEKSQAMTKEILQQHEGSIETIKRKTGELPPNLPYTPDQLK
jgi:predicted nuclease with TOPRIM domain